MSKDILVSPSKYVRFIHIDLCLFHEFSVPPVTFRLCARPTSLSLTRYSSISGDLTFDP